MARAAKSSAKAQATSEEIVGVKPHAIPPASATAAAKALAKVRAAGADDQVVATQTETQPAGDAGKGE